MNHKNILALVALLFGSACTSQTTASAGAQRVADIPWDALTMAQSTAKPSNSFLIMMR